MESTKNEFISIVGKPNVGKSSLLNKLLGEKVAIVSRKPQTTRNRIMGILTENNIQFIFIDTPGFHKAKNKLGRYMVKAVEFSVSDADCILFVVDATEEELKKSELKLLEELSSIDIPVIAVINKIDLLKDKSSIITLMARLKELLDFKAIVPLSAKSGNGIEILKKELAVFAVDGAYLFPEDALTDQPIKVIVAEIIREKFLRSTGQEIPHGIFVEIESMKKRENKNITDIEVTVFCEKESHKSIVIGKQGAMLKKIGALSRVDLEMLLDCKVNLKLWVKVKEKWRNKEGILKNFGYDEKFLK